MKSNDPQTAEFTPKSEVSQKIALMRFAIGLVQGCILYWLYHASKLNQWPASTAELFVPLVMLFSVIPVLAISGLGHLELRSI